MPPATPADMMSVEAGEEDFASDSSSSRPGSRAAHTPDFRRGGAARQGALPPAVEWRPRNRARRFAGPRLIFKFTTLRTGKNAVLPSVYR